MKKFIAVCALLFIAASTLAHAHQGAKGVVKERMDMMGDVAKAMKSIGQMIKGDSAFDGEQVKQAALKLKDHAEHFPNLFPQGSTQSPSEALPIIWKDWEEFTALFEQMEQSSQKLAQLATQATSAADIKSQFGLVGKTCGTCHEKFRLKK